MNIYGIIIIITLLGSYLLEIISEMLNLRALKSNLPAEFADVYDEERYRKSQAYTRVRTRFSWLRSSISLIIILAFWFSGGFNWLDLWVRSWGYSELVTGLMYMGILFFANFLLSLPFTIYSTFVIEEKFGFNKTKPKTFILDIIKGILLSVVIGGLVLAGILQFFMSAGELAWLYCWAAITVFSLVMQFIAPTWIMPLFNKFTPLEEGELRDAIFRMAKKANFPLKNIYVMDGSKRSAKSNAFFTGFGKNKRIALFDTLIEKHTIPELVAILAHEIGHYKKKHILQGMLINIAYTGIMFYLLSIFLDHQGLFDAFYMANKSVYAGLIFFSLLFSPISEILGVFMQYFSRKNEYEADRFAVVLTGDPESMINALKKLSAHNLSNLTPHPFYVILNYSHPAVLERIRAIRELSIKSVS